VPCQNLYPCQTSKSAQSFSSRALWQVLPTQPPREEAAEAAEHRMSEAVEARTSVVAAERRISAGAEHRISAGAERPTSAVAQHRISAGARILAVALVAAQCILAAHRISVAGRVSAGRRHRTLRRGLVFTLNARMGFTATQPGSRVEPDPRAAGQHWARIGAPRSATADSATAMQPSVRTAARW
jgi:hypothetical protein